MLLVSLFISSFQRRGFFVGEESELMRCRLLALEAGCASGGSGALA